MTENTDPRREVAKQFKQAWDQAGKDGSVSPELKKAWIENGVHPDRVQHYANALLESVTKKEKPPAFEDFSKPVVTPFQGRKPSP